MEGRIVELAHFLRNRTYYKKEVNVFVEGMFEIFLIKYFPACNIYVKKSIK
jgi:hypothetical protein